MPRLLPPSLVVTRQEVQPGKTPVRHKLQATLAHGCDLLEAPWYWIELPSVTGARELLSLGLLDSFEHLEQVRTASYLFYSAHPDLARTQEDLDALADSERRVVALRRDDLGYMLDSMDLSTARFVRVTEIHLFPGRELDFAEAARILSGMDTNAHSDLPWVVYQANSGSSTPTFLVLKPLADLRQIDDLLNKDVSSDRPEPDDRLLQAVRDSYSSFESNLCAVSPETSHVSIEFAQGDLEFWRPKTEMAPTANPKNDITTNKRKTSQPLATRNPL